MSEIEQELLASQLANQPNAAAVQALGLGLGTLAGAGVGIPLHAAGNQVNRVKDLIAASQGLTPRKVGFMGKLGRAVKPGLRMAVMAPMGLAGMGIAEMIRQQMNQNAPEARLRARAATGALNESDRFEIEQILADQYGRV